MSRWQPRTLFAVSLVLGALQLGCADPERDRTDSDDDAAGQAGAGSLGTGGSGPQPGDGGSTPVDSLPGSVDWTRAGYPGEIPNVAAAVVDVTAVGATCDGVTDDRAAIQAAIDTAPEVVVIRLPAGSCRIESQLSLRSGVVLRGAGSEATRLDCESPDGCVGLAGSTSGDFVAILDGLGQGSSQIEVADPAAFEVGGGAQIQQDPVVAPQADWGDDNVGQMARIVAIDGSTLTIDPPLHFPYQAERNPLIRPVRFVEEVGIEDLTIRRLDSGSDSSSNVEMRRVANSWIRRVESDFTEKYHVAIGESLFVEVRDSYLHDAKSKGDGGQGYGVSLGRHATSILVENNLFVETRHAMIVQIGTNGCVFGYNYSERNYSDDGWDKAYISLHGHYPFMNLWEGNIVGYVGVGDYWGPAGPGNTLFRNRVCGTDKHESFGDFHGIDLEEYDGTQYVIGNEVMGEGIYGDLSDVVIHGNNVNGAIAWDPDMPDQSLPSSYYLASKPAFFGSMDWPSLGGDRMLGEGSIPALERWLSGQTVPQP